MWNLENTPADEIRRLRAIIARMELEHNTRVISVEMVPRTVTGGGYALYVTAPTATSETEFGMVLFHQIKTAFRVIGLQLDGETITDTSQVAPPQESAHEPDGEAGV